MPNEWLKAKSLNEISIRVETNKKGKKPILARCWEDVLKTQSLLVPTIIPKLNKKKFLIENNGLSHFP